MLKEYSFAYGNGCISCNLPSERVINEVEGKSCQASETVILMLKTNQQLQYKTMK